jgi:hypothetical protein
VRAKKRKKRKKKKDGKARKRENERARGTEQDLSTLSYLSNQKKRKFMY